MNRREMLCTLGTVGGVMGTAGCLGAIAGDGEPDWEDHVRIWSVGWTQIDEHRILTAGKARNIGDRKMSSMEIIITFLDDDGEYVSDDGIQDLNVEPGDTYEFNTESWLYDPSKVDRLELSADFVWGHARDITRATEPEERTLQTRAEYDPENTVDRDGVHVTGRPPGWTDR